MTSPRGRAPTATARVARGLWVGIGVALVALPFLPLTRWSGAADAGPPWVPNLVSWAIGLVTVVAFAVVAGRLLAHAPRVIPRLPRLPVPAVVGTAAAVTIALSTYVVHAVFAGNPVLVDEMAHLVHARAFAAGRLAAPAPQPLEAFLIANTWVTQAGWVSQYPPGQTALLAVGLLVHAEWLVNPLLGGLGAVLIYLVGRGLYGRRTGVTAAVLWALSAWVMFMSATYLSHVGAATLALAAWALVWGPTRRAWWHDLLAGTALAGVAATRPLDAVAASLPILAWIIVRRRWRAVPWLALGAVPVALAWGYVNWRLYGDPATLGYSVLFGEQQTLGFHADPWGERYTPLVALSNAAVAVRRLHIYLYEWPIPALLPLAAWALLGRQRRASDLVVAVGILAAPALYFFYWHSGFYPGPRFYYVAAPMLVLGTAQVWEWLRHQARRPPARLIRGDAALAAGALAVVIWGAVGVLPNRVAEYRDRFPTLRLRPDRDLARRGVQQALVLVPESWGSRLVVGLWSGGVRPALAERAYRRLDACDLELLERDARAGRWPAERLAGEVERMLAATPEATRRVPRWPDRTLRLRPREDLPAECARELARDLAGFTLYGHLAWRNAPGRDRGIVFARDLYERDDQLLAHYPGWEIWRFAPPRGEPDALPTLQRVTDGPGTGTRGAVERTDDRPPM